MLKFPFADARSSGWAMAGVLAFSACLPSSANAADPGKAACMPDAKRLCAHEMHSLSRSKVRACLIVHMNETTPACHDFMVKARAEALSGHKPDASAQ